MELSKKHQINPFLRGKRDIQVFKHILGIHSFSKIESLQKYFQWKISGEHAYFFIDLRSLLEIKNYQKFFLSALVYIFRKTEADNKRKVATCKAVHQLYVQTVRLLEQGVNYFFFLFFLLWTLIASLSDKRALIREWTRTSTICVFSNAFREKLIFLSH